MLWLPTRLEETQPLSSSITNFLKKVERVSYTFHEHLSWSPLGLLYFFRSTLVWLSFMQELFDTGFGPCLNTWMLLLKMAPRLCSATAADR